MVSKKNEEKDSKAMESGGESNLSENRKTGAKLIHRVFDIDKCPQCGSKMEVISVIFDKETITKTTEHLGLYIEPPEISKTHSSPWCEMESCFLLSMLMDSVADECVFLG